MTKIFYAFSSAILFALSIPFSKIILKYSSSYQAASFLYLGSGLGLLCIYLFIKFIQKKTYQKITFKFIDIIYLLLSTLFGGILAPIMLMLSLKISNASTVSLLLNFEGLFTTFFAWFIFKEHINKYVIFGFIFIITGGFILSYTDNINNISYIAIIFVLSACIFWGLDNNITKKISENDPIIIVIFKSILAGSTNFIISLFLKNSLPDVINVFYIMLLGFFSYGLSLVLFILSLQNIGTSRTSAYFSLSPFIASIISILIFKDAITINLIVSFIFISIGVFLHIIEKHKHKHRHEIMEHEHLHWHDDFHKHHNLENIINFKFHRHRHKHKQIEHEHDHFPDIHHTHYH